MRTAIIFRDAIMKSIASVMKLLFNTELTEMERNTRIVNLVCQIIRLEFVLNLLRSSYSVELLEIHSQSWMCEAMHLLEDSNPRWYVDICRQYVADLNRRFNEVTMNPTVDNVRDIFTHLYRRPAANPNQQPAADPNQQPGANPTQQPVANPAEQARVRLLEQQEGIFTEILRCGASWLNNTLNTKGLFHDFFFDMTPHSMPTTWHDSPYPLIIPRPDDTVSAFADFWFTTLRLLNRSRDAGVMVPPSVFLIGGVHHTLPLVDVFCLDETWSSFCKWYVMFRKFHFDLMWAACATPPSSRSSSSDESGRTSPNP
jgi:hypothetical protein